MEIAVVALGGNSLQPAGEKWTFKELSNNVKKTVQKLNVIFSKYSVVLTHGNGPMVGNLLLQQEKSKATPSMPLDVLDAMTQGQLGYLLQNEIQNQFEKKVTTVLTRILVDKKDPAFRNPTKPIGPFYKKKIFRDMVKTQKGWRMVVPSPIPKEILEIACGGGGIPVLKKDEKIIGIEGVIDKDYASELLAEELSANVLIFITDVDYVFLNYGEKSQKPLMKVSANEIKKFLNHFEEGSMKPKILSSIRFLDKGGRKVIITSIKNLDEALREKAGTIITKQT